MYLVKDTRDDKLYKCKSNIENDELRMLFDTPFIKAGVLTEEESKSHELCIEKFPFIKLVGWFDGRDKRFKGLSFFTWRIVFEN